MGLRAWLGLVSPEASVWPVGVGWERPEASAVEVSPVSVEPSGVPPAVVELEARCGTCCYFARPACRVGSPVPVVRGDRLESVWPLVWEGDWCGRYASGAGPGMVWSRRGRPEGHGEGR